MTTLTLSPRRAELMHHLDEVLLWSTGEFKRRAMGRYWRVNADMTWLLSAGLIEQDPEDDDKDDKGFRPTEAGREWLATHDDEGNPR